MNLRDIQKLLVNKAFNPYIDIYNSGKVLIHLVEEIGEVCKAYREPFNDALLKRELGDCVIMLLFLASSLGFDLEECTLEKIKENIDKGKFKPKEEFKFPEFGGLFE